VCSSTTPKTAQEEPRQVEPPGVGRPDPLQEERSEDHGRDPQGEVDEEDPAPREIGDQEAAEHGTECGRHGGRDGQDAGGADPLGGGKDPVEHGHPDRRHHAAARTLNHSEDDQLRHALR
jgi:hypothetical protein